MQQKPLLHFFSLFRINASLLAGLTAFTGTCLAGGGLSARNIYAVLAAITLYAGCSDLSRYQERAEDAKMAHTANSALPSGLISPGAVLSLSVFMIAAAVAFMAMLHSRAGFLLMAYILIIYNLIFIPLKKITPLALLAGSAARALAPVLGYTAVGGAPDAPVILMLFAVLYAWKVPHLALLSEKYSLDNARAGFKTLSGSYGTKKANLFINAWLTAYICSLLLVPVTKLYVFGTSDTLHTTITVLTASLLLLYNRLNRAKSQILNLSIVFFFLLLVVDRIII